MNRKPEIDDLADFDADALYPQEEEPSKRPLDRRRKIGIVVLAACAGLFVFILQMQLAPDDEYGRLVEYEPGSPVMNIGGPEREVLGEIEGPYILINVENPRRVTLGGQHMPTEQFDLIGLSLSDTLTFAEANRLTPQEAEARDRQIAQMNAIKTEAIRQFCGAKTHFIIRMSPAAPNRPSLIYLLQPVSGTNTSSDFRKPNGQAYLVNAALLREGKGLMALGGGFQPMYERMLNCQLAAYIEARRAKEKGAQRDCLWTRFDLPFTMDRFQREQLARMEHWLK